MTDQTAPPAKQKTCFVIGPIGSPDSNERTAADWLLHAVIRPVLEDKEFGFKVMRADEFPQPGLITNQVISLVMDSELVVADLTGHNANAFYELAIRHMVQRPTIHMIRAGEVPPFDIKDYRAIFYQITKVQDVTAAKEELRKQVAAVLADGYEVANPITHARGRQQLAASSDTKDQLIAQLIDGQNELHAKFEVLSTKIASLQDRGTVRALAEVLGWKQPLNSLATAFQNSGSGEAAGIKDVMNAPAQPGLLNALTDGTPGNTRAIEEFIYTPPPPKKPGAIG